MLPDRRFRSFLDPNVLSRLSGIPLFARKPMLGAVSGRHPSPHRGASVEFAEYRKYVPGDDPRRMDWRAYGRSDRYYIKEFEADTNLRCCLIVDTSGSMDFGSLGSHGSHASHGGSPGGSPGSRGVTKLEYARRIAGSLGYLAVQQGDAVGLACVAENIVRNVPPRRNPGHLRLVFDMLEKAEPQGGTRLVEALHELAETIRQRALVVILSDLFVEPDAVRGCLEHLRFRKHDVAVFHLLDPMELAFPFHRPTRFVDMEGGTSLLAEPSEIADRYQRALRAYLDGMRAVMLDTAVDYHRVSIDEDYEPLLGRFLIGRARGRGGR